MKFISIKAKEYIFFKHFSSSLVGLFEKICFMEFVFVFMCHSIKQKYTSLHWWFKWIIKAVKSIQFIIIIPTIVEFSFSITQCKKKWSQIISYIFRGHWMNRKISFDINFLQNHLEIMNWYYYDKYALVVCGITLKNSFTK